MKLQNLIISTVLCTVVLSIGIAAGKRLRRITVEPTGKHDATLFFFHGTGEGAFVRKGLIDFKNWGALKFQNIKVVYPTAPWRSYTPAFGLPIPVWFDRRSYSIEDPEVKESIDEICKEISKLIEEEVENGIPESRIVVGGFSMGGALAMHVAYRYKKSLAGCVAMSSFLNDNSSVYEELKNEENETPLFLQFHGQADHFVPIQFAEVTYGNLTNLGVVGELIKLPGVKHQMVQKEVERLKDWLSKLLPETS